jgi:phosphoglycolate phosphatase-like HAD superfamily hydrolase
MKSGIDDSMLSRRTVLQVACLLASIPALIIGTSTGAQAAGTTDPLRLWNNGPARQAILEFVQAVTDKSKSTYVLPEDRIATFDQDGTLWVEHPLYAQAMFALDRVRILAPSHPTWKDSQPFSAILAEDQAAIAKFTEHDWTEIIAATHAGMSTAEFLSIVTKWLATARHPVFKRPYTELIYQPMLGVMEYLRANGFRTYIVTGGGQEFVRAYAERVYGVPPEQVIGSSIATDYEVKYGKPELMRLPRVFFIDDGKGKAIGINLFIGKRPYAAFGNSNGDREMLEWTGAGDGVRLKMLVHHDDVRREFAYGPAGGLPDTKVGTFPDSLMNEAMAKEWTIISMKRDWKQIFAFE